MSFCLAEHCDGQMEELGHSWLCCSECGHKIVENDFDHLHDFMIDHYRKDFKYEDLNNSDFWEFNEEDKEFYYGEQYTNPGAWEEEFAG